MQAKRFRVELRGAQLRSDLLDVVSFDVNQTYRAFNPLAVTYFKCAQRAECPAVA